MTKSFKKSLAFILSVVMLLSVMPAGLSFAEGTLVCGDYEYILSENEATITKYKGSDTVVVIPETLDGNTVVRIGADEASRLMPFHSNATITSVTIPDSVKCIGYGAFYKCTALENVVLGDGIEVIEAGVFRGCTKLASIALSDNITTIGLNAFKDCPELAVITIGDKVESIGTEAFLGCGKLATVNFKGTISQWNELLDGVAEGNDNLVSADIVYCYGMNCQHENAEIVNTVTCTEDGIKTTTCLDCGNVTEETVNSLGHNITITFPGGLNVVTPPTCTETGIASQYCSRCEKEVDVTLGALGHIEAIDEAVAPTCTAVGKTEGKHCSVCDEILVAQEDIPMVEHAYGEAVTVVEPTCTEKGKTEKTCADCGYKLEEDIPALGHNELVSNSKDATCTEAGFTASKICRVCGVLTESSVIIPALGHDYVVDETLTIAPTCEDPGAIISKCTRCDAMTTEVINALGHDITEHEGKDATCTEDGYKAYQTCNRCDYTTYESIEAFGHTLNIPAATCTEDQICTVCNEVIASKLHHNVVPIPGKAPSCTVKGYTEGEYCDRCNVILKEQFDIPAPGHTPVKVEGEAADCTTDGLTDGSVCSGCGTVLIAQVVIPATGHKEVVIEAVAPTCTKGGSTAGAKCETCGEIFDEPMYIKPYGHNPVDVKGYEATCTEAGLTDGKQCSRCGKFTVKQEEIPAKDHTLVIIHNLEPTCTEAGYTFGQKCKDCGEVTIVPQEIPATGHTAGTAATCTKPRLCTVCGEILIEALGHTPGAAATCTAPQTCTVCSAVITPMLPHDLEYDMTVTKPATCYSDGYEKAECKNCDYGYGKKIPAFGHNVQFWTTIVYPTCYEEGKAVGLCINCKYNQEKILPALEHKDDDGNKKCDYCKASLGGGIVIPGGDKEEDKEDEDKCSCNCHAIGIKGLIFDFILFIQRLFGLNKTCKCGEAHY